jgi:hypothetical protein
VFIQDSSLNMIGGTSIADRNVISGNVRNGIFVFGPNATDNGIEGNLIGTDGSGQLAKGNGLNGIVLDDAGANTIGGLTVAHRNIISANALNGIVIAGDTATGNKLQGNYIGLDITGTQDLGNVFDGVLLTRPDNRIDGPATNDFVGGMAAGSRNVISGNGQYGIEVFTGANGNVIQQNYIGVSASHL